ncbi:sel1 repeat family protein [Butyrivibrio sp. CB08]|uniref:sel1 repeat family protein n=1 Tax=Butyrivibrio sp. CB08 TaxID=2364879 RepID=UPI000EA8BFDE|nr:sel1 repeat family protein [Butyrivibrio sp. CB08]RKM56822.1 sel1 repeat family protein [Butyrivibrio sp. CB08]
MTEMQAKQILREYYENVSGGDGFMVVEALEYLIETTKDPKYMHELAWYYATIKRVDLEEKYLLMATEYNYGMSFMELGYIYYYGQNGVVDYKKAYQSFSKGAKLCEAPDKYWCMYKLADFYHNGYYVKKNEDKYRKMIEGLYSKMRFPKYLSEPFPEVVYRLANIRIEDKKISDAVYLLECGKEFMQERLRVEPFWGHIELMGLIVNTLYGVRNFDYDDIVFWDLFYLVDRHKDISFKYQGNIYKIETDNSQAEVAIKFGDVWYKSKQDFFEKARIDEKLLTAIYEDLYKFEVA